MDRQWLIGIGLFVAVVSSMVSAHENGSPGVQEREPAGVEIQDASELGAIERFLLSLELIFSPRRVSEKVAPLYAYSYDMICGDSWDNVAALNPEHGGLAAVVFYHEAVPRAQYYPTIYAARHAACRQDGSRGQPPSGDPNAFAWTAESLPSPSGDPYAYIATTFPLIGSEAERRFLVRGRERVPSGWAEPAR